MAQPTQRAQPTSFKKLVVDTYRRWSDDKASRLAAAVAYYAIFSIGPLLIITIAVVGLVMGRKAASDQIRPYLTQFIGDKAAEFAQRLTAQAGRTAGLSIAGVISIVLIIYAAGNLFVALQDALNTIFSVEAKPGRNWWAMLRDRGMALLMVLVVGAFMLASIVLNTALGSFTKWGARFVWSTHPGMQVFLLQAVSFFVSAALFTGAFAVLFKYLPDIKIDWRDTLIGALATAILFTLARIALGYYLARGSVAGPYGAAGSLVVIMLFIYYSAQIFFFGAEFTRVWACRRGKAITPSKNAVIVAEQPRPSPREPGPVARQSGDQHWWRSEPAFRRFAG